MDHMPEVVEMIVEFDGLRNIVLACGATRMKALCENSEMGAIELGFYSRAVTDVNHALAKVDWNSEDTDDAVLMAVCFLYIHGVGLLNNTVHLSLTSARLRSEMLTVSRYFLSAQTRTFASTSSGRSS